MKSFLISLFSSKGAISSKRFAALTTLLVIDVISIIDLLTNYQISVFIFDGLLSIVLIGLGFTTIEKFKKSKNEPEINPKGEPEQDSL